MLNKLTFYTFLLLVFSMGFMYPSLNSFGTRIPISDFIFLVVFFLWILTIIFRRRTFKFDKLFIFSGLYLITAVVSTVFSANPSHSLIRLSGLLYLIALPVLALNLIETKEDFKKVFQAWMAGTLITVLIGISTYFLFYLQPDNWLLQYFTYHYGAVPVGNYPRLSSTFISASMFCNYLSVSLALICIAYKLNWISSLLFYFLYTAIVFCAVFTISSGLGAVFFLIGIWIWFLFRDKHKFLARLSLAAGIFAAISFVALNIFALQKHSTSPYTFKIFNLELSPSPRIIVWHESFLTFINNFWTGKGLGEESCRVLFQNTDGSFSTLTDAHNMFLSVASQSGIFGLTAILLLSFYILIQKSDNFIHFGLWLAVIASFIYQGLIGSFEDARHIWLLMGIFIAGRRIFTKNG